MRRSCGDIGVAPAISRCTSTAQRTASTTLGELDQEAVAGGLDDAAAMLGDLGIEHLAAQRLQRRVRTLLVLSHQPRIAGDIGRQDRRQPPLDALSPGSHGL